MAWKCHVRNAGARLRKVRLSPGYCQHQLSGDRVWAEDHGSCILHFLVLAGK